MSYIAHLRVVPPHTTVGVLVHATKVGQAGAADFLVRMRDAGYGKLVRKGPRPRHTTLTWADNIDPRQICQKFLSRSPNPETIPLKYKAALYGKPGGGKTVQQIDPPEDATVMALELMKQAVIGLTMARRLLKGRP